MRALFLRTIEADDKASALRGAVRDPVDSRRFEVDPVSFQAVPKAPFAYWVSQRVRRIFRDLPRFEADGRVARLGGSTKNDFRFLRLWHEIAADFDQWKLFAKGGTHSCFYSDIYLVVKWCNNAHEIESELLKKYPYLGANADFVLHRELPYLRPGLTWPRRTQSGFGIRAMPAGCIFADKGPAAFVEGDSPDRLLALLAITTSAAFCYLVELQMAFGSYEVGVIQRTPVPNLSDDDTVTLARLARRAWFLKRNLDTTNETSHAFVLPPGTLGHEASPLFPEAGGFNRADIQRELAEIQAEIDDKAFALYGIGDEDRATIEASMTRGSPVVSAGDDAPEESNDEGDDSGEDDSEASVELTATPLTTYSWLVGVAFGRFDPRLASSLGKAYRISDETPNTLIKGQRPIPPEPEPFDPLPARSPGMWPEGEVPVRIPPDIIVDDPGHDHDIRTLVANAAALTGWPDPYDLRQWLAKEFFPLHIKMYSRSRRKAPIYWQLATPSASYSVWLYIHAFTKDTLFRIQNDYVAPKLAFEEQRLRAVRRDGGFTEETDPTPYEIKRIDDAVTELLGKTNAPSKTRSAARKEVAMQESLVEDLRAFRDEVKRVAPLWNPDLNDGVIINFAPLWRLVPQHRVWQKECKSCWDKLVNGDYDWAHLAMHLWPERVVPKCAEDRSLAIAHGLEDFFWHEDSDGKWQPRRVDQAEIDQLVGERTSAAVKDALKSLLEAPAPSASGRRGAAGGKTRAARTRSPKPRGADSSPEPRTHRAKP